MDSQILSVIVGIGQPHDAHIILNIHFISPDGIEWTSSFSYGQLCQLDNFITESTGRLKHVAFPVASSSRQQKILELITDDNAYAKSNLASKHMIEKLRSMLEVWIHVVLMRLHCLPLATQEKVAAFFCLPLGPVTAAQSAAMVASQQTIKKAALFGFLGFGREPEEENYSRVCARELAAESSQPPLLRVSVARGPEGPHGKLEYQITIVHSSNPSDKPFVVLRRFSEFAQLHAAIMSRESPTMYFSAFPVAPAKCSFGIALDEAELSIRTRALDTWLRETIYLYHLMCATSRSAVRTFLNIVAVSAVETSPVKAQPATAGGSSDVSGTAKESSLSTLMITMQNRLADGLVEASRAENYEHVMKGAVRNRLKLLEAEVQAKNLAARGKSEAKATPNERDDDAMSEDSHMADDVPEALLPSVSRFKLPFFYGKKTVTASKLAATSPTQASPKRGEKEDAKEPRVHRYFIHNASVSGENPYIVPFGLVANNPKGVESNGGSSKLMGTSLFADDSVANAFIIRHQDYRPNLFDDLASAAADNGNTNDMTSSQSQNSGSRPRSVMGGSVVGGR